MSREQNWEVGLSEIDPESLLPPAVGAMLRKWIFALMRKMA